MSERDTISVKKVALVLGVHEQTVRRWVRLGLLAHDRATIRGARIRIHWPLRWVSLHDPSVTWPVRHAQPPD